MHMQFLQIIAVINLGLSLVILGMLMHYTHRNVDSTTPLRSRLFLLGLAVYFLFHVTGSTLYLADFQFTLQSPDSVMLKLLYNYRPSRLHIILATLGLAATVWMHRRAWRLHHPNPRTQ